MKYAVMAGCFFGGIALMLFLHIALPPRFRRNLILGVTFLSGLYYVLEFMLPETFGISIGEAKLPQPFLTDTKPTVGNVALVVGSFTIALGLVNLTVAHAKRIRRRTAGWGNSVALLVSMYGMIVVGLWQFYLPDYPAGGPKFHDAATDRDFTTAQFAYEILFAGVFNPLDSTMFALLAFFITSAAYRAFRVRSLEAGLMMAAAFIVMIGAVPLGQAATSWIDVDSTAKWLRVEAIKSWILTVPNSAAQQGLTWGVYVGAMAMGLRIWLSLEKGAYFEQQ